jgi:hypothetical protein
MGRGKKTPAVSGAAKLDAEVTEMHLYLVSWLRTRREELLEDATGGGPSGGLPDLADGGDDDIFGPMN